VVYDVGGLGASIWMQAHGGEESDDRICFFWEMVLVAQSLSICHSSPNRIGQVSQEWERLLDGPLWSKNSELYLPAKAIDLGISPISSMT
jgi:hypothetical protein